MKTTIERVVASLLALVLAASAGRAEAAALAALANVTANNDKQAAEVTIGTGATAVVPGSSPLTGAAMAITDTGYDETGNRLFVVDATNNKLLTINMANGAVLNGPTLAPPAGVIAYTDLEWDAGESVLYGIVTVTSGDKQLATFNLTTGAVALVGAGPVGGGVNVGTFSQPFDLDAGGNRYYFIGVPGAAGTDTLYSVNTATGAVADSVLMSTKMPAGTTQVFGLEFDPSPGVLYALIGLSPSNDKRLATINTISGLTFGSVTLLGPAAGIGGGNAIAGSGYEALDPTGNRYYFKGALGGTTYLFAIDTATGNLADQDALTFGPGINDVRALEFDGVGALPVELESLVVE